jgi:2,4-dienoyl-CoA reductase-like NADH-dependent reductase (Old Yellow Enzyme family)
MPAALFTPLDLGPLSLPNRIAVAPMCQYSAQDGTPGDWHLQHWMTLALSGAGMITIEATGVTRQGRITHGCLGLYSDDNEVAVARTLAAARRVAPAGTRFGIQIGHAGRKASTWRPWEGSGSLPLGQDPWEIVAPSALPHGEGWRVPRSLTEADIEHVIGAFAAAARRAERAGFDFVEVHGAHGYLAHEFLSPLANRRSDQWGGSLDNRMRFVVAVARAVRAAVSAKVAVGARLSVTDWLDGGITPDESVAVAKALKDTGLVYICASSGGISPTVRPPVGPGYMVPFAERIRREAGIATRAVGMIEDPLAAEEIVAGGKADLVAFARAILADPRWPWRAAAVLGEPVSMIAQYALANPVMTRWGQTAGAKAAAA